MKEKNYSVQRLYNKYLYDELLEMNKSLYTI